jgi:hypothetical protein
MEIYAKKIISKKGDVMFQLGNIIQTDLYYVFKVIKMYVFVWRGCDGLYLNVFEFTGMYLDVLQFTGF